MAIAALALLLSLNLISLIAFITFKHYLSKAARFVRRFPNPPTLPFVGSVLELCTSIEEITQLMYFRWPKLYGPRSGLQLLHMNYFTSMEAEDLEGLLTSHKHLQKGIEYDLMKSWLGEGLLTSSGQKWYKHRKLLTPAFHFKILEEFMSVFNEHSRVFVDVLNEDSLEGTKVLEVWEYVTRCTLDVICETAMGRKINAQRVRDSVYVKSVYGIHAVLAHRMARPWLHPEFIWRLTSSGRLHKKYLEVVHGFTNSVIQERKKEQKMNSEVDAIQRAGSTSRKRAFLDLLLQYQAENPSALNDQEIREETDTFMFEGHDTTAASISWTIYLLGLNAQCQARVHEELNAVFGNDKERPVESRDLSELKYLECCIKEALRLYPSVPFISRYLHEDLHLDDNTVVPAGVNFPIFIMAAHRNEKYFPDPEAFMPERFFPENSSGRHPFAYIPFSAGPRNCIGQKFAMMEEKVVLAHLFRNFRIESLDKREDIVLKGEVIIRPRDGFNVRLIPK